MLKILIADDEKSLMTAVSDYFKSNGFETVGAFNGEEAYELVHSEKFDLIILDVMMPGINGFKLLQKLRSENINTPVIFLTAKTSEEDQIEGFNFGADDYITKPFSLPVLLKKSTALINRSKGINSKNVICCKDITIDLNVGEVYVCGKSINLTHKEYELLKYFLENKNLLLSREKILDHVWGFDYFGDIRVVDTYVKKLRKKLGPASDNIKTIIKEGYKFSEV